MRCLTGIRQAHAALNAKRAASEKITPTSTGPHEHIPLGAKPVAHQPFSVADNYNG